MPTLYNSQLRDMTVGQYIISANVMLKNDLIKWSRLGRPGDTITSVFAVWCNVVCGTKGTLNYTFGAKSMGDFV